MTDLPSIERCGYFGGKKIPAGCRHLLGHLIEALAMTPCYGCSVRFGDNTPDGLRGRRGCVNCRKQRAALALAGYSEEPNGPAG
jgi:hypothetical protein